MCYRGDVFLFDVDGTLTPPRQKMTQDFLPIFTNLVKRERVYLVSGSDISKIKEQIPKDVLQLCQGIFASSANQYWKGPHKEYENIFIPPPPLLKFLKSKLCLSEYPTRTGNHIEYRPGMLNFSIVGRGATLQQRSEYTAWDTAQAERTQIARNLEALFPNLEAVVGGEISIDIYPRGKDKSQAVRTIKEMYPERSINFFGDRTGPQGNDYSAVVALDTTDIVFSVLDYKVTKKIIASFLEVNHYE